MCRNCAENCCCFISNVYGFIVAFNQYWRKLVIPLNSHFYCILCDLLVFFSESDKTNTSRRCFWIVIYLFTIRSLHAKTDDNDHGDKDFTLFETSFRFLFPLKLPIIKSHYRDTDQRRQIDVLFTMFFFFFFFVHFAAQRLFFYSFVSVRNRIFFHSNWKPSRDREKERKREME